MNDDDSEQVSALLQGMGYTPCERQEDADIAVLVTCSVREKPEQKAKSKLGELRVLKEEKPGLLIGLCGCMAQRVGESVRKTRPFIDFVVGTGQIHTIPEIIRQIDEERRPVSSLYLPQGQQDGIAPRAGRETRALKRFVPVMYGCDNFCSYCVVPYARGRERSRPVMDIIDEISQLAGNGCKDVTLLGQNVNSYGQTLEDKPDFADLLGRVNDIPGIERIRFTTSHPKDLSDRLIEAMRDLPKVCEHIHLAVQSGDDEVLARMNRKYTRERLLERIAALRAAVPEICITTDFLVGFPGETREQFENTMSLAQEVRFDAAFMFAFNPIPKTAAAKMEDQVSGAEKNARLRELIAVQNAITCEINNTAIGRSFQVLVEGNSPRDPTRQTGLTRQNKTMNFPTCGAQEGDMVEVTVTEGHLYGFVGECYHR